MIVVVLIPVWMIVLVLLAAPFEATGRGRRAIDRLGRFFD